MFGKRRDSAPEPDRSEVCFSYLEAQGYRPERAPNGMVTFKADGFLFALTFDTSDEEFYQMVFPNFWPLGTPEEKGRAVEAAARATADTKVAKVFLVDDNVWATTEAFCGSAQEFTRAIPRGLRALRAAAQTFADRMNAGAQ
ncbi:MULTISPECIES: hypothetical protein [Deferrisoma]